eukprot:comp21353_c0_seq2/m.45974 comp21353_c0_seq2/g.45974  ORF comp21353_c0_seq2/g.45974 comp21353_c0_seq2/m.45974 type:complete len:872 (+) comp21353_c0_seq2:1-2616(+)
MRIENPYANSFGVHMDISSKIAVLKKALVKNPYLFADLIAESFFQLEAESKAEQDEQRAILDEDELAKQGPPRKPRDLLAAYVYPDPEFNNKMLRYQNSMLHHEQNNLTPEKIEEIKKLNEDLRRHQEREDFPKNVLDYLASRYLKSKVPWSSNIAEYIKTLDAAEIERLRESEIQYPILQGKDAIRFEIMQLEERRAARRAQEEAEAEAAAAAAEAAEAAAAAAAGGGGDAAAAETAAALPPPVAVPPVVTATTADVIAADNEPTVPREDFIDVVLPKIKLSDLNRQARQVHVQSHFVKTDESGTRGAKLQITPGATNGLAFMEVMLKFQSKDGSYLPYRFYKYIPLFLMLLGQSGTVKMSSHKFSLLKQTISSGVSFDYVSYDLHDFLKLPNSTVHEDHGPLFGGFTVSTYCTLENLKRVLKEVLMPSLTELRSLAKTLDSSEAGLFASLVRKWQQGKGKDVIHNGHRYAAMNTGSVYSTKGFITEQMGGLSSIVHARLMLSKDPLSVSAAVSGLDPIAETESAEARKLREILRMNDSDASEAATIEQIAQIVDEMLVYFHTCEIDGVHMHVPSDVDSAGRAEIVTTMGEFVSETAARRRVISSDKRALIKPDMFLLPSLPELKSPVFRVFSVPSPVSYMSLSLPHYETSRLTHSEDNLSLNIFATVFNDSYLHPAIREKGGAYGTGARNHRNYLQLSTYRDPGMLGSLDVFEKCLNDFLYETETAGTESRIMASALPETKFRSALISDISQLDPPVHVSALGAGKFTSVHRENSFLGAVAPGSLSAAKEEEHYLLGNKRYDEMRQVLRDRMFAMERKTVADKIFSTFQARTPFDDPARGLAIAAVLPVGETLSPQVTWRSCSAKPIKI